MSVNFGPGWRYNQDGELVYNLEGVLKEFDLSANMFGLGAGDNVFQLSAEYNKDLSDGNTMGAFQQDIAQSRYFTVTVSEIRDKNNKPITFHTGGAFHDFLPVKNMSLSYASYDNLSVPLAPLSGIPLLNKKRLSVIRLSCYDTDDDIIEKALQRWEMRCFPGGKYVAYMDDIAAKFQYKSYDVKGNLVFVKTLYVIPTDDYGVNRSYEENSEKLLTFSLAAVGEIGASANGHNYGGFLDTFERAPVVSTQSAPSAPVNLPPLSNSSNTTISSIGAAISDYVQGIDRGSKMRASSYASGNGSSLIQQAVDEAVQSDPALQLQKAINSSVRL